MMERKYVEVTLFWISAFLILRLLWGLNEWGKSQSEKPDYCKFNVGDIAEFKLDQSRQYVVSYLHLDCDVTILDKGLNDKRLHENLLNLVKRNEVHVATD